MGRRRIHNRLPTKGECVKIFNKKVVYQLRLSTGFFEERFNTKVQEDWAKEHDTEIRVGIILKVWEVVPQGQYSFKQNINYTGRVSRSYFLRKVILLMKDVSTGFEFYVNLCNIDIDEDVFNEIVKEFAIPNGWIQQRITRMSRIGKNFETILYENKLKGEQQQREKELNDNEEWFKERIGTSRTRYLTEKERLEDMVKYHKKQMIRHSIKLDMMKDYWERIEAEGKRTF